MKEKTIALVLIIILAIVIAVVIGATSYADQYGYYSQRGYGSMMGGYGGMMNGYGQGNGYGNGIMGGGYNKIHSPLTGSVFIIQVLTARADGLVLKEGPCGLPCEVEAA